MPPRLMIPAMSLIFRYGLPPCGVPLAGASIRLGLYTTLYTKLYTTLYTNGGFYHITPPCAMSTPPPQIQCFMRVNLTALYTFPLYRLYDFQALFFNALRFPHASSCTLPGGGAAQCVTPAGLRACAPPCQGQAMESARNLPGHQRGIFHHLPGLMSAGAGPAATAPRRRLSRLRVLSPPGIHGQGFKAMERERPLSHVCRLYGNG